MDGPHRLPGVATALGLFAAAWVIVITKLILGIAAGSIVLLVGSSNLVQQAGGRSYTRNQALGFSALGCFCIGYAWLVVDATR